MNVISEPRIANDLIWRLLDDNAVVVSPHVGEVRVLNGVGTVIWRLLVEKNSPDQIEAYLVSNYKVSQRDAHQDLYKFLDDLTQRGIVTWEA